MRHQCDHITPRKIQLFQENDANPDKARLYVIMIRRREIELISNGNKLIVIKVMQLKVINFKDFMQKYKLKNATMNESELQRIYDYPIYPRVSNIYSDRGFVKLDDGFQGGSRWTCFYIKDNKSYYFDSFGGQTDKFLLKQLANQ